MRVGKSLIAIVALAAALGAGVAYQDEAVRLWQDEAPRARTWILSHFRDLEEGVAPAEAASAPKRRAIAVETAAVETADVVEDIRAFGTLVANERVVVAPEIAGRVARIPFAEAERVRKGDVLVELDATILEAELAKARSDLDLAAANFERARKLAEQGSGTLRARDETTAALTAARANVALAEARLSKARLVAPFAGVVGFRAVSAGAYVSPGERIVDLAAVDPLKVEFQVSETYLPNLRIGLPVEISMDARPGEAITGEITAIDPIVDVAGRAIRLRAQVPNPDGRLSPGLFSRIRVIVARRPDALLVPESAIFQDGGQLFVYRIEGGKALKTEVAIGQRRPGDVEVREGLADAAVVVTAGQLLLRDGASVDVVKGPQGG